MQIITFVTIYAVLSQMTFLSQNTRFSRHFWVCYQAPITFNDVCLEWSPIASIQLAARAVRRAGAKNIEGGDVTRSDVSSG